MQLKIYEIFKETLSASLRFEVSGGVPITYDIVPGKAGLWLSKLRQRHPAQTALVDARG